jgi:hypothetical protein
MSSRYVRCAPNAVGARSRDHRAERSWALHRQATRSHRPSIAGTAMPLAAPPYRASGLVLWHKCEVPTIGFRMLYGFVIVRLDRRDLVWINVTTNPTAEWIAGQITEAFSWDTAPLYDPRSGSNLRHCRHATIACHGHPGQAYCTSLTLAEWLSRTADRIDPA